MNKFVFNQTVNVFNEISVSGNDNPKLEFNSIIGLVFYSKEVTWNFKEVTWNFKKLPGILRSYLEF
jgi:hypothetical protein